MKSVIMVMVMMALFCGCKDTDTCLRKELFNDCLDKADVVDYLIIKKCQDASYYLAQRESKNIREECR